MKTSARIAICVILFGLCASTVLVYRHLQASTQDIEQVRTKNRYLTKQLDEQRHQRHSAEMIRFEQLFDNARLHYLDPGRPFDQVTLQAIFDFSPIMEECVAISAETDWDAQLKAAAGENLARIRCLQNRMSDSEQLLRTSLAVYTEMQSSSRDKVRRGRATTIRIGIVQNRLGWVLNALGRSREAASFWRESIDTLKSVPESSQPGPTLELAFATRNLGLAELALSDSGDLLLQDSHRVSGELSRRLSEAAVETPSLRKITDLAVVAEFHIDTCQLLHARFWQRGELEKSEAVARESLELLHQLFTLVERTLSHCPWLRYQNAEAAAKANLQAMLVSKSRSSPESVSAKLPASWHWQPLHCIPGETIFQEVFTEGLMHAEFEPQEGLVVSWIDEGWASHAITEIVAAASRRIRVYILVGDDVYEEAARKALLTAGVALEQVTFWRIDSGTLWIRDFGPNVIETSPGRFQCLDSFYRSGDRSREDFLPRPVADRLGMVSISSNLRWSGGEFLTNGAGLSIASTFVLDINRQTGLRDADTTLRLKKLTGTTEVVFLDPLSGEPTQHVDWFATFTAPDTVVVGDYRGLDAENTAILNRNAERLSQVQTPTGPLKVVRIPMPPRGENFFGGTYTNVVFANGVLLVPTWPGTPRELEDEAMRTYQQLLPGWEIIGIDCSQLGVRNGALHCATINLFRTKSPTKSPRQQLRLPQMPPGLPKL